LNALATRGGRQKGGTHTHIYLYIYIGLRGCGKSGSLSWMSLLWFRARSMLLAQVN